MRASAEKEFVVLDHAVSDTFVIASFSARGALARGLEILGAKKVLGRQNCWPGVPTLEFEIDLTVRRSISGDVTSVAFGTTPDRTDTTRMWYDAEGDCGTVYAVLAGATLIGFEIRGGPTRRALTGHLLLGCHACPVRAPVSPLPGDAWARATGRRPPGAGRWAQPERPESAVRGGLLVAGAASHQCRAAPSLGIGSLRYGRRACDPRALCALESRLWAASAGGVEAVELSPVTPFGTCTLAGIGQDRIISTTRGTEVVSDCDDDPRARGRPPPPGSGSRQADPSGREPPSTARPADGRRLGTLQAADPRSRAPAIRVPARPRRRSDHRAPADVGSEFSLSSCPTTAPSSRSPRGAQFSRSGSTTWSDPGVRSP